MSTLSTSVPLAEAKSKFSELVERVIRGEEFIITRHDAEIARLVPATRPAVAQVGEAIARMRATRPGRHATAAEIRDWKLEGRR